jgi:hypothetical protein
MLARTGPRSRRDTWIQGSEPADRLEPDAVEPSGPRSGAGLRCADRGIGPDRSGSSLPYVSVRGVSFRTGADSDSCDGISACAGCAAAPGAAVPVMIRLSGTSAPGERGSWCAGGSGGVRCDGGGVRAAPRCHGGTSLASEMRPAAGSGVDSCGSPRSTEPFPFGLSPGSGHPGSSAEVTPAPYVCTRAVRAVAVTLCRRVESNCPAPPGSDCPAPSRVAPRRASSPGCV